MALSLIPFQFDNLVKGRIPFGFINLGADVGSAYSHVNKYHLENMSLPLSAENPTDLALILDILKTRGYPMEFAIVVLCDRGSESERLAASLESAGYKNVFYLKGGWEAFLEEQKAGF